MRPWLLLLLLLSFDSRATATVSSYEFGIGHARRRNTSAFGVISRVRTTHGDNIAITDDGIKLHNMRTFL